MRATIKMIAEKSGVSIGTVDRVLHNRPYVREEIRSQVLQVMEELDYRPNRMASALAKCGVQRRFAVVMPDWTDYVRDAMEVGVKEFRKQHADYNVETEILTYPHDRLKECAFLLGRLEEEKPDGIALCGVDSPAVRDAVQFLTDRNIPVITFNTDIMNSRRLCYVGENARQAGQIAGGIAAKFCRPVDRILMIYTGSEYYNHQMRVGGFMDRVVKAGVGPSNFRIVPTHNEYDLTYQAVRAAIREEPALRFIYMANLSVEACVQALRDTGKAGKIRVLVHDCPPEVRQFLKEGVVDFTIDQDFPYQTNKALSLLFNKVQNHQMPQQDCYYGVSPILTAENCG